MRTLVALLLLSVLGLTGPAAMGASGFTDSATVTTGAVSARTVLPPDSVTCTGGGLGSSLTFVWPNKDTAYTYLVQVERPAGTVRETYPVANTGDLGVPQSYVLSLGLLGSLLGGSTTFTVRVRSQPTGTTWVSESGPTDTGSFTLGVLTSC